MTVDGAQRFTGILHDLSARVLIEKQLREQTSLAKLGEMAAVIAHEVKNPLAGVRGGAAAVRALTNTPEAVDVVMLDYRLPDSNDLALLAAIRRLSPSSGVILMTV